MEARESLTIAIVEDNPAHRETYSNMIRFDSSSHVVDTFENANNFLAQKEKIEKYQCLLLDVKLPDINGIELSRIIRQDFPHLPIVFMTAYSDDDEALVTISEGAEDYLPKGEYNQKLFMRSIRYAIERKNYQVERLKLIEDLRLQKELNAQQKEFVSMVSHEFRTPLAIISSSVQLLERILPAPDDTDKSHKHLIKIRNAIKRLSALIDNTLCYSKLEEGKITYHPTQIDLKALIEETIENYQQLHPDLTFHLTSDALPPRYFGDANLIQHVLFNVLSNAIKYSRNISTDIVITASLLPEENNIVIDVIDHGKGIPKASLDRVGERFYRADNTTGISGSGIGLFIVQRMQEMQGGRFELLSEEGKGTTARITIPLTQPTQEAT